jgi:hypothetical protein
MQIDLRLMLLKTRLAGRNVLGNPLLTSTLCSFSKAEHELNYSSRMGEKISHKYKSIFIHVPKAAGSSIREVLYESAYGGSHATAREFEVLFPEAFACYFKFAVVRNPWDRLVSAYAYFLKGGNSSRLDALVRDKMKSLNGFEGWCEYLHHERLSEPRSLPMLPHFIPQACFVRDKENNVIVDSILRFENLQNDFESVNNGIFSGVKLETHRSSEHGHYRSYYNAKTQRLVASIYSEDIEMFDYSF